MILDVISVVLLLVTLGLLLFFGPKRSASIKEQQTKTDTLKDQLAVLIQQTKTDTLKDQLAVLIQRTEPDTLKDQLAVLIQRTEPDTLPPQIFDFDRIRNEFKQYVERESTILQCKYIGSDGAFIKYESGCLNPKINGLPPIWINAWIPEGPDIISAAISVDGSSSFFESHYQQLKVHKSNIETVFSFETIDPNRMGKGIHQLRVQKDGVDLTQTDSWETEFRWLRENLERLYWVLQVHNELGWDAL